VTVTLRDAPADARERWELIVSDDEPDAVRLAAKVLTEQVQSGLRHPPSHAVVQRMVETERNHAKRDRGEPTRPMMRALFGLLNDLRITDRDDRLAWAAVMLERDIESFRDLSYDETRRLLDGLNGYVTMRHLRLTNAANPTRSTR
jgi:hypothetical protein